MRLHHSSTLTAEYFLSYAQLVMNSRELFGIYKSHSI